MACVSAAFDVLRTTRSARGTFRENCRRRQREFGILDRALRPGGQVVWGILAIKKVLVRLRQLRLTHSTRLTEEAHQFEEGTRRLARSFSGAAPRLAHTLSVHCLHEGHFDAAKRLSRCSEYLLESGRIERHSSSAIAFEIAMCNVNPVLTWCRSQHSTIRRLNSALPFNIILREICECSQNGIAMAIAFGRKQLSGPCTVEFYESHGVGCARPCSPRHFMRALDAGMLRLRAAQRVVTGLLAGSTGEKGTRAWRRLAMQFEMMSRRSQSLPAESALEVSLRVGLSVLNTSSCMASSSRSALAGAAVDNTEGADRQCNRSHHRAFSSVASGETVLTAGRHCPLCTYPSLAELSTQMPVACVTHSFLRCCICYAAVTFLLLPCRHLCVCSECAGPLSVCPICEECIVSKSRIFLI